ncbi:MAG: hypothetical protein Ct9H300mP8_12030 [Gammaproteobacteria bacterium]|nr:MAG: hypothetical protein Ct9H300mP8_12030 [Gammaproteobacteria bacterium]
MIRYHLPVKMIVLNNGGIGGDSGSTEPPAPGEIQPPGNLTYGARYDLMVESLGGKGWYVRILKICARRLMRHGTRRTDANQCAAEYPCGT